MADNLKWFVIWDTHMRMWAVRKGGFTDYCNESKYLVENRCDELNSIDKCEEGHLVDDYQ